MIFLAILSVACFATAYIILKDDFLKNELKEDPWSKDA
jgi:hypothetical protein